MYCYRELDKTEYPSALELALKVFMEYEAPDYSEDGTETFRKLMSDDDYIADIRCCGAFDTETNDLTGMIATRSEGTHITLFFVDGRCHRRGIGRELMRLAVRHNTTGRLTVNSSPYAVEIYKKLGFFPTGPEEVSDGIRFTHMEKMI